MELIRRQRLRSARGAELIELAMVLPLLLLLIGGIVDFALMFQAFEVVNNAAREGARVSVLPGYGATDVQNRVAAYITASGLNSANAVTTRNAITLTAAEGGGSSTAQGYRVTVTYTHTFTMLGPLVTLASAGSFPSTLSLVAVSAMRREM